MKKVSLITDENIEQSYRNTQCVSTLGMAEGDYVLFTCGCHMDFRAVEKMLRAESDVVYCDERIGDRVFRKPDYSPHTLLSYDYIGPCLIKRECIENHGTSYEILKELSRKGASFFHIDEVLAEGKREFEINHKRPAAADRRVSIIIPSKDNYDALRRCIDSIRQKSTYKNYEIIVTDNGSGAYTQEKYSALADKYIYEKSEFNFSHMCNMGAAKAEGEVLLFLNDDTEVISPDWLENMVSLACLDNSGAVGAKLYYPNSRKIQHCGVINISNGPVHALIGQEDSGSLYFGRSIYNYNCIAVSAACLCINKDMFTGFDESFKVAYNDVDMCFSLYERGLYNIVCNEALLYHYESMSRGNDLADRGKMKRLVSERKRLYRKHSELVGRDPFYSKHLTQLRADFRPVRKIIDRPVSYYKNIRLVL